MKLHNIEIDKFTEAYITCALWASIESDEQGNNCRPLDDNYGPEDLAEEAVKAIVEDCKDFQEAQGELITQAIKMAENRYTIESAGHDFFLTRCGHGAGFWDRGLGTLGTILSDASKIYGNVDFYTGDDGQLYVQ